MEYCTYLTIYSGTLMPKRYIGSSTISRINTGYNGSVLSKKYKDVWNSERKENPHLFKTRILKLFETKELAQKEELELQIKYDVVRSNKYLNMSLAQPNGFFGMSTKGRKMSDEAKHKNRIYRLGIKRPEHSKIMSGRKRPEHSKSMMGEGNYWFGKEHANKGKKINQARGICLVCGVETTKGNLARWHKHE